MKEIKLFRAFTPDERVDWLTRFLEIYTTRYSALIVPACPWTASRIADFRTMLDLIEAFSSVQAFVENCRCFGNYERRVAGMRNAVQQVVTELGEGLCFSASASGERLLIVDEPEEPHYGAGRITADERDRRAAEKRDRERAHEAMYLLADLHHATLVVRRMDGSIVKEGTDVPGRRGKLRTNAKIVQVADEVVGGDNSNDADGDMAEQIRESLEGSEIHMTPHLQPEMLVEQQNAQQAGQQTAQQADQQPTQQAGQQPTPLAGQQANGAQSRNSGTNTASAPSAEKPKDEYVKKVRELNRNGGHDKAGTVEHFNSQMTANLSAQKVENPWFGVGTGLTLQQVKWMLPSRVATDVDRVQELRATAASEAEQAKALGVAKVSADKIAPHAQAAVDCNKEVERIYRAVDRELAYIYGCLIADLDPTGVLIKSEALGIRKDQLLTSLKRYYERALSGDDRDSVVSRIKKTHEEMQRIQLRVAENTVGMEGGEVPALTESERKKKLAAIRKYFRRTDVQFNEERIKQLEARLVIAKQYGEENIEELEMILKRTKKMVAEKVTEKESASNESESADKGESKEESKGDKADKPETDETAENPESEETAEKGSPTFVQSSLFD